MAAPQPTDALPRRDRRIIWAATLVGVFAGVLLINFVVPPMLGFKALHVEIDVNSGRLRTTRYWWGIAYPGNSTLPSILDTWLIQAVSPPDWRTVLLRHAQMPYPGVRTSYTYLLIHGDLETLV